MIEIKDLTKVYRDTIAVDHFSLDIKEGEVFGLLGPNGAGKTTLILMLSTLLEPTSGTAAINKNDILESSQPVKRDIGIIFQDICLDEMLTGHENLEIQAVLHDMPKKERVKKVEEMLDFVGLNEWAQEPVGRYSGGMKKRLEIARSLIHNPRILLLDEPTLGLDPTAREVIWTRIEKLEDLTIVIATNYIEEAEALCDRLAIMDRGRVVALGSADELKSSLKMEMAHIRTTSPQEIKSVLEGLPYVDNVKIDGSEIDFTIEENRRKDLLDAMASFDLESIEVRRATLSDVFKQHTGRSIDVPLERTARRRGLGRRRR